MATKDIDDLAVVLAYLESRDHPQRQLEAVAGSFTLSGDGGDDYPWPHYILAARTGQPLKVCYRAMERAYRRGLVDYGVSLRSGWVTEKGKALIRAACAGKGVPVPPQLDAVPPPLDLRTMASRLALVTATRLTPGRATS